MVELLVFTKRFIVLCPRDCHRHCVVSITIPKLERARGVARDQGIVILAQLDHGLEIALLHGMTYHPPLQLEIYRHDGLVIAT